VNPVAVAAKGKGAMNAARRAGSIGAHYGVVPKRMERRLETVVGLVEPFGGAATLPITAAALGRNPRAVARFVEMGIEFPVHGLYHVDHIGLDPLEQDRQLAEARRMFEDGGIPVDGFRAPYLRWNEATMHALVENGYTYDSSQSMHWPIAPELETDGYRRGLEFYTSLSAAEHPVVPRIEGGLVRIPCCLPDDESVVDRLTLAGPEAIAAMWVDVFERTHARGELFTMQVHPERIGPCGPGIAAVLEAASRQRPGVWIARLGEIARWWRARGAAEVSVDDAGPGRLRVRCRGPEGLTVLARHLDVPGEPWGEGPERVVPHELEIASERRPFVGVDPTSPPRVGEFLREQGYIVETDAAPSTHTAYVRRERFDRTDELPLLEEMERQDLPLVRFGRWPNGTRSAVAVTGDVDALTIWDYAARFVGR
jgi:peptidoglycan/xylan/chitin deacetylase (PgdA/CDA1 family)